MTDIIAEVESSSGNIIVSKNERGNYDVIHNDVIRHPNCSSDAAIRALSSYLQGALFKLENKNGG